MKKRLKLIIFIFCSMILLLVFATLLLPSKAQVTGSVTVLTSDSAVLHQLKMLKTYPEWFPWISGNASDVIYYGDEGKRLKGFSFRDGENKDNYGRFELGRQEGDSILHYTLQLQGLPEFYGAFAVRSDGKNTLVAWKLNVKAGWKPWSRFYAAMMYKMTKPALDSGLDKLKKLCEQ